MTTKKIASESLIITLLAAVHFCIILDFVIMMPLGPQLLRVFGLTPAQFSIVVSSYTFAAAIAGFLASFFVDKMDRKVALTVFFMGFGIGTVACGLAWSFESLMGARILAGAFAGLSGPQIFSILGDLVPFERRGVATGRVGSAFPLASIVGIPLGLVVANVFDWHVPFWGLGLLSVIVAGVCWWYLPPLRGHIKAGAPSGVQTFLDVIRIPNHWWAMALSGVLVLAGFTVIPFISPYVVRNVGYPEKLLPLVYLFGGLATFFSNQWIGRLVDAKGQLVVFRALALLSIPFLIAVTHQPEGTPVWGVIAISTCFMVTMSGRFVPALAMMNSATESRMRGSFMSLNSSLQQGFMGLAALLGGLILDTAADGKVLHYNRVGYTAAGFTLLAMLTAAQVRRRG